MIFDHEPHYVSPTFAPQGPTPLWCKLAFAVSIMAVILITTHCWWSKWL